MTGRQPDSDGSGLRQLVQRAADGDGPSLDQLLMAHLPRLRAFVRVRSNPLVRQYESCSDIVQSVCREVLQATAKFEYRGDGAFRAWLFRTALNKILERTRSLTQKKRDVRREVNAGQSVDYGSLPGREPTASQMVAAGELSDRMERAFDQLPDDYREVIALSRIVGLSHAEVAEQLGRSEGAVRMLLSRALVAYIDALDKTGTA
jgi:RNA polymerase sigma-70 factor (ECF subfamily)